MRNSLSLRKRVCKIDVFSALLQAALHVRQSGLREDRYNHDENRPPGLRYHSLVQFPGCPLASLVAVSGDVTRSTGFDIPLFPKETSAIRVLATQLGFRKAVGVRHGGKRKMGRVRQENLLLTNRDLVSFLCEQTSSVHVMRRLQSMITVVSLSEVTRGWTTKEIEPLSPSQARMSIFHIGFQRFMTTSIARR